MDRTSTIRLYMDIACRVAEESYCVRAKVGAVVVTKSKGLYVGFNGTPNGYPNFCELPDGSTNPLVVHAEENALSKMLKEGVPTDGAVLYTTMSPCIECTKMLYSAGIREVYYLLLHNSGLHLKTFEELGMKFFHVKY